MASSSDDEVGDDRKVSRNGGSEEEPILTAAELLRRRLLPRLGDASHRSLRQPRDEDKQDDPHEVESSCRRTKEEGEQDEVLAVDLDEEIRRLEAALQNSDSSEIDEEDDESESFDVNHDLKGRQEGDTAVKTVGTTQAGTTGGILCLSSVQEDRIESLPAQYLPTNKKRILKSVDKDDVDGGVGKKKKKSQKASDSAETDPHRRSGLERAVQEVLAGYQPRSSERLPFYCRVCAQQYENADAFFQHRQSDFHTTAVEMERKLSFCKLCRKQLTSPAQLHEHLQSRPHHERLERMKQIHHPSRRSGPKNVVRGGGPGRGRGQLR